MLELHQLDWQLQSTEAVSNMLDAMHNSKAASSALPVRFVIKLIITGLSCSAGILRWPALLNWENLSTGHAALPAMKSQL